MRDFLLFPYLVLLEKLIHDLGRREHPNTGGELRSFNWEIGKVCVAAVSPDGTLCVVGGDDGRIVVWDVDS